MRTIGFVHHTRCQPAIALATIEHSDGGGASLRSAASTIVRFLLRRTGRALASSPVIRSAIMEDSLDRHRGYADEVRARIGWTPQPGRFHVFKVDIADVTFIRYQEETGDQFVARWPDATEFVRRGTSATSSGRASHITSSSSHSCSFRFVAKRARLPWRPRTTAGSASAKSRHCDGPAGTADNQKAIVAEGPLSARAGHTRPVVGGACAESAAGPACDRFARRWRVRRATPLRPSCRNPGRRDREGPRRDPGLSCASRRRQAGRDRGERFRVVRVDGGRVVVGAGLR